MNTNNSYSIPELCTFLRHNTPIPARLAANLELKVLCPGPDDGDCGVIPTTTPLDIPDIATLIVSPTGCSLHLTETGRGKINPRRAWILNLEEKDIVSSDFFEEINQAVYEIKKKTPITLKGLIICGTCIDALLGTDYASIASLLEKEHDIRITYQIMGPILKGTPRSGQYHMYTSIYNLLRKSPSESIAKSINILGPLHSPSPKSELPGLLKLADIDNIFYMGDFSTLEDCDCMTNSILNIVTVENALTAAKELKRKFNIPFLYLPPSYNPETIHANYQKLSDALNITIDDSKEYMEAKMLADRLKSRLSTKICAVGERNIYNTLDVTLDLIDLGCNIKKIFLRKASPSDLPKLEQINNLAPNVEVCFDTHPSLWNYSATPDDFDLSFGVPLLFIKNASHVTDAPIHFPFIDYASLTDLFLQLEKCLDNNIKKENKENKNTIPNPRKWNVYKSDI